ncbi:hypothetical protein Ae201684P_022022 [Aphanomyces euteiches]|nr:hypothetical protein Ae201684P_022022 [Aphanomyces euteiches]
MEDDVQPLANLMDTSYTDATRNHASAAMKKFVLFLENYNNGAVSLDTISSDDITEELFGKFAAFLVSDPNIGYSTSTTYLSSVKRQNVEKTHTTFFDTNNHWYKTLRLTLRRTYLEQTSARGLPLQAKAPLMTLEDLRNIGRIAMGIGCSSDVGDLRFTQMQWIGSYLLVSVNLKKTVQQHSVSVFSAALEWAFDPLHSLAAQLSIDPFGLSERVFSQIAFENSQQDNVSGYINRLLSGHSDKANDIELTPNLRSHSSRRGAAVVAAASADVKLSDLAHRGRWTMDGYNTIFEYIAETTHSDQKVARVLGCWQQPTQIIEPAKLDSYGPKALPQQAFARRLFAHYTSRLQKESFVFALAAVLLVYYTDTMTKYPQHKVLDAMAAACTTVCGTIRQATQKRLCENGVMAFGSALSVKM